MIGAVVTILSDKHHIGMSIQSKISVEFSGINQKHFDLRIAQPLACILLNAHIHTRAVVINVRE